VNSHGDPSAPSRPAPPTIGEDAVPAAPHQLAPRAHGTQPHPRVPSLALRVSGRPKFSRPEAHHPGNVRRISVLVCRR
jgi:hypothetical protein